MAEVTQSSDLGPTAYARRGEERSVCAQGEDGGGGVGIDGGWGMGQLPVRNERRQGRWGLMGLEEGAGKTPHPKGK